MALATPDDKNHIITSTAVTFNGVQGCLIRNKLGSNTLQVLNADQTIAQDNIGSYFTSTGKVSITGLNISAFIGSEIKISAVPANQSTIKPLRNHIIRFDEVLSKATGTLDFQNTPVTLT